MLRLIAVFALVLGLSACPSSPAHCDGHAVGESFPAADGCNTCSCEVGGVTCTLIDCSEPDAGNQGDAGRPVPDAGAAQAADAGVAEPQVCGTRGAQPCPRGLFCNHPPEANCGRTDHPGVCAEIPEACDDVSDEVCGCDGNTYGNPCSAALAGVSVDHAGRCGDAPGNEACDEQTPCDAGEYCFRELGICGGAGGECQARPDGCAGVFEPVCGCDGQTYSNACAAAAAGANVVADGACVGHGDACGPALPCADGFYCERADGQCAEEGNCVATPNRCTRELRWVCGCDGESYTNACMARTGGTSIDFVGRCDGGGPVPGGGDGAACDALQRPCDERFYCQLPDGQCIDEGVCVVRPGFCNRRLDRVCGCDGETYGNPCEATRAGTTTDYRGFCR